MDTDGAPVLANHSCATASICAVIAVSAAAPCAAAQYVRMSDKSGNGATRMMEAS
jgi:hypothetical protein